MDNRYKSLLDQARRLFDQHNYLRTVNRIDIDEFFRKLQSLGGTTLERLKLCQEDDLVECGLPRLIARQTIEIFKETLPPSVLKMGKEVARELQS